MSVIASSMLDFSTLGTPARHTDVLVAPSAADWLPAAERNHTSLGEAGTRLLGSPLAAWRRGTRMAIAGVDDRLVFVLGHQPEFIHPGVWAKRVAATHAAQAAGGIAVNLVVDTDVPRSAMLRVPVVTATDLMVRSIPLVPSPTGHAVFASTAGHAYEHLPPISRDSVLHAQASVREAMGDRYDRSQMPVFFESLLEKPNCDDRDWVGQFISAVRAIEQHLGVVVSSQRVSAAWGGPLLLDMLLNSDRFAASYNKALASYRREHRIRGSHRPIPDLLVASDRCELPIWVYLPHGRRHRLFVRRTRSDLQLMAEDEPIGALPVDAIATRSEGEWDVPSFSDWCLRPRALALTLWARLLLADLFIHGIGGAKYDRIADKVIADYYGLEPPMMACVSATLHLDLPGADVEPAAAGRLRHTLHDLAYNPQRHVSGDAELQPFLSRRSEAVRRSDSLRENDPTNRRARREVFAQIRRANEAILKARAEEVGGIKETVAKQERGIERSRTARSREFFFGLFDHDRLQQLLRALPQVDAFRK